jgi:hypothetical protein
MKGTRVALAGQPPIYGTAVLDSQTPDGEAVKIF